MRVDLAAQVRFDTCLLYAVKFSVNQLFVHLHVWIVFKAVSERVANALEMTGGDDVSETVRFIRMMDKFFDCMNVTNFSSGIHKKKHFQEAYRRRTGGDGTDDFRLKVSHCTNGI